MKIIKNFAINLDSKTREQFDNCCEETFVHKASLMPDAHYGYVAPIGSVLITIDHIVPSWVGYDIGCGMIACKFVKENIVNEINLNSKIIFDKVNVQIPMGKGKVRSNKSVSRKTQDEFDKILKQFKNGPYAKDVLNMIESKSLLHLGTLGSGNHFIELGFDSNNKNVLWLIIHSGSRGVGHTVATHYMKKAADKNKEFEKTFSLETNSLKGKEYLNVLNFGLEFALLNRLEMAYKVRNVLRNVLEDEKLDFELWVNKNHNHIAFENGEYIHRKGATPAKLKERGVIPANMRDGSFLVEGLGNEEFLNSSSHGAGRRLSRSQAKTEISMKDFEKSMKGIVGKIDHTTLDEAPEAYKNIYDVMEAQKESVKAIAQIKPIINWKG
ncbi:RtcB family protein [Candidatus Woesearchaeota archaeon]|jgi:tRNA-splicing ligase RtcB (3'-phosphate/5'-hydroxy nucleic acid ligase)|nr:RtcB family protein [Candidatus Woesearchaeota archaeon]MBT4387880.1 RtcB family protein [Candidatus Woesearchaeota archaeon]MBT4595699.1 RtcB family protein [Candidatus Woesearchaeota archaeon]MBT5741452.1 RtcB family protein [Candidatus Woesearchaeota archaeon]MBT6505710.1 RtcB family protein [Candidatus Woesearchaeota archaeon]